MAPLPMPPSTPPHGAPDAGPGRFARRSRRRRIAVIALPILALLVAALAGGLAWLGGESALRAVVERAAAATGGRLSVEGVQGSLLGVVRAKRIVWSDAGTVASADDVVLDVDLRALGVATLRVRELTAAHVEVVAAPSDAPAAPPASLALPMRVELVQARIGELVVRQAGAQAPLRLEDLRASARYRTGTWTLDALSLRAPFGTLQAGGTIADAPPFALQARALLETRALDEPLAVDATAGGTLSALDVDARAVLRDASASAKLALAPFAPRPLVSVDLSLAALDLSRFVAALPATRLEGRLQARAAPEPAGAAADGLPPLAGTLSLRNARPGTLDAGRLPLETLATRFVFDGTRLRLDGVELAGPPGRLAGEASVSMPERAGAVPPFALRLETDALDLKRAHAGLRPTALRGTVAIAPAGAGLAFDARLADGELALEGRARLEGERLDIERARLRARDGVAELAGRADIAAPYRFELAGTVSRLDPSRFAEVPPGLLNGTWRASGVVAPVPAIDAAATLADSRWRDLPASGRVAARWASAERGRVDRLSNVDVALALGASSLRARGDLGEPADRLTIDVDAPRLRELDARLGGRASLDLELRGAIAAPALSATVVARDLRVDDQLSARTLRAGVDVASPRALVDVLARLGLVPPSAVATASPGPGPGPAKRGGAATRAGAPGPGAPEPARAASGVRETGAAKAAATAAAAPSSPLSVVLQADGLKLDAFAIDTLRADLSGDADRHALVARATAAARGIDAALRVEGALERGTAARWNGRIVEASNSAAPRLRLLEPAALAASPGTASVVPLRVEIDGADGARLSLDEASWRDGRLRVLGTVAGVPLRWLGRAATERGLRLEEPDALRIGARVDLAGAPRAGGDLRGRIEVFRESGDVTVDVPAVGGGTEPLKAGLQALEARIEVADGRASATAAMRGTAIGTARADARMPIAWTADGALDTRVPIEGSAELSLPSLAFTRALAGEAWRFDGALEGRVAIAGTLDAPRLTGRIEGSRLVAEQRELGMRLTDGVLVATLAGGAIEIERMRFASGGGSVTMTGTLRADERSEAVLTLERLPVPLGTGQRLVLSGESRATLRGGMLVLRGALRADEGVIELTAYNAPSLAKDVVVVRDAGEAAAYIGQRAAQRRAIADGTAPPAAEPDAEAGKGFRILSNMEIDLGEKFRVFGAGVDARLEGRLVLRGRLPDAPRLTGTVKIVQGTWTGFGQKLEIERGTLVFSGPVDNPALDIVAYRRYLPVEAGVSVSGTARVPKLALVSKPDVPEAEKLSWLVLGTGSDNSRTGAQTVALQAAAASILASADSNAKMPSLAQTFGLDVVAIRTGQVGSTGESGSASTSAQDSIVTLGKRLTDRLFVSYEQSLRGLQNLVRLQYEITGRLSLRGSAGTRNAVDLLWQYRYD